ncbi:hypothetical protein CCHL11_03308 [Colletotrichum chlorophyti]|uniref:Uncharacterized protein n=1 Tax=Colletotrichum chlorophyti TaxID=708187 RepID=A0A1Q8S3Q6_9PEZI|nr:hypothetical protein CCHL11_03308 [Colletotrichum chlorophyti]
MKFTLINLVVMLGAVSAFSIDIGLVKKQLVCAKEGQFCAPSVREGCCGGLICRNKSAPNTNICEPEPSPAAKPRGNDAIEERSDEAAPPQARDMPTAPQN